MCGTPCTRRPPTSQAPTHTHTRLHFRGRRGGGVVHVLIRRVDAYTRGRVLLVRVVRILRALAARTTRPVSSSARRAPVKRDQRKPHTRAALVSLGACRPCAASHSAHGTCACSGLQSAPCAHRAPSPAVRGALRRRGGGGIGQGQAGEASQGQVQDDKCKAADGPAQQAKVCQQGPSSEVTLTA